jgi:GntR family transcriptional regulator/MocR family aminotransferase
MTANWPIYKVQFCEIIMVQLGEDRGQKAALRICDELKGQIEAGTLAPGGLLPSTRALAGELGVSRTTVTEAYEQLLAEGFIETRPGAAARVSSSLGPSALPRVRRAREPSRVRLSAYGRRVREFPPPPLAGGRLLADFRYGDMSAEDFPAFAWRRALNAVIARRPQRLRYGDAAGAPELRAALQAYLWRARHLRCDMEQIIVVNGSQQGLDLCARVLLDDGDRFVIEDPCYAIARHIFLSVGAVPLSIAADDEGLQTARLDTIVDARVCYVTPSHQFPLGGVLSAGRRQQLLAWARRTGACIIEDDYDSEYRFDIGPIRPLQTMGEDANVIYLGTVSKTLSPALRLGYLVVPPAMIDVFTAAKRLADRHTPTLDQQALAELMSSGAYERHVRRARRRNAQRRAALLDAISVHLGDAATIVGSDAGLHVVVWLNAIARNKEDALITRAQGAGLGIYPVTPLYGASTARHRRNCAGLVMGYAALDERDIRRGVERLAATLRQFT